MSPIPVIFDLDGTLIDSRGDIVRACRGMLADLGRPSLPSEVIASFVGDGARVLVERALGGDVDGALVERGIELFLHHYEADPVRETVLLPGVAETLDALEGHPLAVCTNKPRRTTLPVLRGLDLERRFRVVVAGGDTAEKKPDPAPILRACALLGVAPSEAWMIGDGPQDVLGARAAGVRSVGVKGGILDLERLLAAEPDFLLESMAELPPLLFGAARERSSCSVE